MERTFAPTVLLSLFLAVAQAAPTANKDFNGDGKADVLWRNGSTGDNYMYPMDAKQILSSEGYLRAVTDQHWNIAGIGDFNGDGTADLLWRHSATGENYVYFMNGTAISSEGYLRTVADTAWKAAGIGDFDGDGKDDILWRNAATGENYIYLLNGLAITAEGYVRTVSNLAWKVAGVGDTDGDGKADILWRNSTTGENYLYPMSGTTILGTEGYLRTVADANWRVAGIGDVNGDGRADILWRNVLTGQNYVYPLNGTTILGSEGYLRTVADLNWQVAMMGDFDGDAKADILWRNTATGENYIYFLDGTSILATEGYIRAVADLGWQVLPFSAGRTDAPWGGSTIISNQRSILSYEIWTPVVAMSSQSVGYVAWQEEWGECGGRVFVNRNAGGVWASSTGTDVGNTQAVTPHIAANASNDAIVAWVERAWGGPNCGGAITGNEVWVNRYSAASGTWSGPVRVSVAAPPDSTIYAYAPATALDDAGRAMVVWIQGGDIWYSRLDGTWSTPAMLSNSPANSGDPKLALDGAGNVMAVWTQDTNAYDPGQPSGHSIPNVWSARFNAAAGTWSTPARIGSADLGQFEGTERVRLAVNASGNAVAIWQESRTSSGVVSIVGARYSASSGTWTTPVPLESSSQQAYWPDVAIDAAGNAQAVWIQKINAAESYESGYTARMNGATGTWGTPLVFEQSPNVVSEVRVGMDNTGLATIAWNQTLSLFTQIHAVQYTPGSGFGPVTHLPGDRTGLAVNGAGTALLATKLTGSSGATMFYLVRAAMFRP